MKLYTVVLICLTLSIFGTANTTNPDSIIYSSEELQVIECLSKKFIEAEVDLDEIRKIFEEFYAQGGITDQNDPLDKQYKDILNYWEKPTMGFPLFTEKQRIVEAASLLKLDAAAIQKKVHLNCFVDVCEANEATIDPISRLIVFYEIADGCRVVPNVSPGLIARVINAEITEDDLKKELYQNAIALTFIFDMSLFLSDGKNE